MTPEELNAQDAIRSRGGTAPANIVAHGKLPHAQSLDLVRDADFTVFLRNINRVSTCGFSTKFVESLSVGTPVITNITGDLGEHLRDMETGLICDAPTAEALTKSFMRLPALSGAETLHLREAARREAESAFGHAAHVAKLSDFVDSMRQGY